MPASDSAFPYSPAAHTARPTIFSFPLTWSLLTEYPELPTMERAKPVRALTLPERVERVADVPGPDQWEMVIPKMVRPPKRLSTPAAAEKSGNAPAAAVAVSEEASAAAAPIPAPEFTFAERVSSHLLLFAAIALLAALVIGAVLLMSPGQPAPHAPVIEAGAQIPLDLAGWVTSTDYRRRVSILRGSLGFTDYRLEFQGRIEGKALGWVFRAKDPQNFYANKLEIVKQGFNPVVALKRFAVINGQDQPVNQILLTIPARLDTTYKVRVDALGNQFTTWVMDQKVDQWSDDRLRTGGVGWYGEYGERRDNKIALSVFSLIRK